MASRSSSTSDPLTPQLLGVLRAQLAEGERLAWAGSPEPAASARTDKSRRPWDAPVILGLGYATLGAIVMVVRTSHWLWLALPASLLLLGTLVFLVNKWIDARARRTLAGTVYGVTTRRVLLLNTYPSLKTQEVPLEAIEDICVLEKRGVFGDLGFGATSAPPSLVFRGIPDPERTRKKLMRMIRDPAATDQELAASETYLAAMRQLARR